LNICTGWIRICQDELGSQEECKKLMHKALKHGKSVIIDRCNVHVKERKMWILEAQKAEVTNIESLFLNPGIEVCKQRVRERKWHPTLSPENGDSVIEDFAQTLKAPEKWEGFQKIMIATSDEELKQIIKEISDYPVETKKL
jgi:predicted kinase